MKNDRARYKSFVDDSRKINISYIPTVARIDMIGEELTRILLIPIDVVRLRLNWTIVPEDELKSSGSEHPLCNSIL